MLTGYSTAVSSKEHQRTDNTQTHTHTHSLWLDYCRWIDDDSFCHRLVWNFTWSDFPASHQLAAHCWFEVFACLEAAPFRETQISDQRVQICREFTSILVLLHVRRKIQEKFDVHPVTWLCIWKENCSAWVDHLPAKMSKTSGKP